jgi:MoxR-like ATPase
MSSPTSSHDLKTLFLSHHPLIVIETVEEDRATALVRSVAEAVKLPYFDWSVTRGLVRPPLTATVAGTSEPKQLLQHLEALSLQGIFCLLDFARFLSEAALIRRFREVAQAFVHKRSSIVLTGSSVELPPEIEHLAVRYPFELPGPEELAEVVATVAQSLARTAQVRISLTEAEKVELVQALRGLTANQARQVVAYAALHDGRLAADDLQRVIERKAALVRDGGLLEYFPVEDNRYELGGFGRLKSWLRTVRVGFTPEAQAVNLAPPRGILLVGVQGCGKSLSAKFIAREWRMPLLKLDAGRLYDKYIGESEKNFHRVVKMAETMAPVVLWIDEIEKALVATGSGDADAGVGRRIFGLFLTWLQEKKAEVFVVATANDLSLLPPELLRKGRFDEIFFVDLPDAAERAEIFRLHLRLRRQEPERFDVAAHVALSDGFSGAEIEQVVIAGLYRALSLKQPLSDALLRQQIEDTIPLSVSRREDIVALRWASQGRFVRVGT